MQRSKDREITKMFREEQSTNLLVKECAEEMTFQIFLGLPLFPLFQQLQVHINNLYNKKVLPYTLASL